jgi:nucleotide-binding universal stress UspA family protein
VKLLEERIGTEVAIKNILFATDFSLASEAALPYVTALSLHYGSTVHVAHVLPDPLVVGLGAPDPAVMGAIYEGVHITALERIQQLGSRLKGYAHQTYIRHGKVADEIADLIERENIDLLVLGTHGRTGLGRLLMGSVAEQIFRMAPVPVLTVGPRARPLVESIPVRHEREMPLVQLNICHILYATDLSPVTEHGCSYAVSLAREFRSKLTLLHVIEDYGEQLRKHPKLIDEVLGKLRGLLPEEDGFRYMPELLARYGSPAEVVLETAEERDADLIVMGVRSPAGLLVSTTHLGGSTAHGVVVGANCPVLTVRNRMG